MNKQQLVSKIKDKQATEKKRGTITVGGGLYCLVVGDSASWLVKYSMGGVVRSMGLGSADAVTMSEAQDKAADARTLARNGTDPKQAKVALVEAANAAATKATADTMTFAKVVEAFDQGGRLNHLKGDKQKAEVLASLQRAADAFGSKPVSEITCRDVKPYILKMWDRRTSAINTIKRLREVFLFAAVNGDRDVTLPNPADLDTIVAMMPSTKPPAKVNRPAVPWQQIPEFMGRLRATEGLPARALELMVLLAARRCEVMGLTNGDIDFAKREINFPAERMKMGKPHTQPMSGRVEQILRTLVGTDPASLVFQGRDVDRTFGVNRVNRLLDELFPNVTVHGTARASFRTWADETKRDAAAAELCLAHVKGDAYNRGERMADRKSLMADWSQFCDSTTQRTLLHLVA